jgi:hypothetical protein
MMKRSVVPDVIFRKLALLFLLGTLVVGGCAPPITRQDEPVTDPLLVSKKVSFAGLEGYRDWLVFSRFTGQLSA